MGMGKVSDMLIYDVRNIVLLFFLFFFFQVFCLDKVVILKTDDDDDDVFVRCLQTLFIHFIHL